MDDSHGYSVCRSLEHGSPKRNSNCVEQRSSLKRYHGADVRGASIPRLLINMFLDWLTSAVPVNRTPHDAVAESQHSSIMRRFLKNTPVTVWVRLFLGAVFVIASADKIIHPAAFARSIYNYQILPDALINLTAIILPWLELLLGSLLIVGWWLPGATVLVNLLLIGFFGALVFNVARGLDVHCGCFSTSTEGTPATTWYLIRDSVFLVLGCFLTFRVIFRPYPGKDPTKEP